MRSLFIDIHLLQTVPPSNLNRDDTGAPKSAFYGGLRRARVSSQAWKRATRAEFANTLDTSELGVRTKRVVELLRENMLAKRPEMTEAEARDRAVKLLEALKIKVEKPRARSKASGSDQNTDEPDPVTEYLIFFSNSQIGHLADIALEDKIDKKSAQVAADTSHGIELALFGRMVADAQELSVDASVQVAHAISTHAVELEQDYFTAVDDCSTDDESGAGMLGSIEFNSATLYRYATVNVDALHKNLGESAATVRAVQQFVSAFIRSMPTGKQNTFANRTAPDAAIIMVRRGQPLNLVGAFENAVVASEGGFVQPSADAFARYAKSVDGQFAKGPDTTWIVRGSSATEVLDSLGERVTLEEMLARLEEPVASAANRESQ